MAAEAAVVDMSEETPLVVTKAARERRRQLAGIAIGIIGLVAVAARATGTQKAIPTNWDELRASFAPFTFIILVLCHSVREITNEKWEMAPGLQLFAFCVPFAIISGAADNTAHGTAAHFVHFGCLLGLISTVLDQMRDDSNRQDWRKYLNLGAALLVILGCVMAGAGGDAWSHAPFFCYGVLGLIWAVTLLVKEQYDEQGFNDTLWLLVLTTAAAFAEQRDAPHWMLFCMKLGALLGVVFAFASACGQLEGTFQRGVIAAAYALLWFPLCLDILRTTTSFDAFLKNVAMYAFAVTLTVRAVFCILFVAKKDSSADDRTDDYVWLFALYLALANAAHFHTGGSGGSFQDVAGKLAQLGPLLGLVTLVCAQANILPDFTTKMRHVAEVITVLGIFLA